MELTYRPPARSAPGPYHPFHIRSRVFTPAQCRRIVDLGSRQPTDRGELLDQDDAAANQWVRDSVTAWIPRDDESEWIFTRLADVAERVNERYGFELGGFLEDLQFTTYDRPGSHYAWHQDGLDGSVGHRKLSIVVQLSDPADYRGGELEFLEVAEDYDDGRRSAYAERVARQGTAIVFPAFEFHRVRPLRRGARRSLVAWVAGPPFR